MCLKDPAILHFGDGAFETGEALPDGLWVFNLNEVYGLQWR